MDVRKGECLNEVIVERREGFPPGIHANRIHVVK